MEYPKLKEVLNTFALLEEEKRMWLRLGMYVAADKHYNTYKREHETDMYDGQGNVHGLGPVMAMNLRTSILNWWEVEKVKPRAQEVDITGLNQLENRNGN